MDLTAYESLSWEKQFEYLKQMKGFTNIEKYPYRQVPWKTATKDEALKAWKEEVKRMRSENFQKNILKPREEKTNAIVSRMGPPLMPPQAGIITERPELPILAEPLISREKSLQQLESEVNNIVREVLSRYG